MSDVNASGVSKPMQEEDGDRQRSAIAHFDHGKLCRKIGSHKIINYN